MSQRLVNVVCMVFTLAAAVYLYVFMREYAESGSAGSSSDWSSESYAMPQPTERIILDRPSAIRSEDQEMQSESMLDATRSGLLEPSVPLELMEPAPVEVRLD